MTYLDCWISVAKSLFSQALAGEPELVEGENVEASRASEIGFVASFTGDVEGRFSVFLDSSILNAPLLGDGVEQATGWREFLREVAEAAAGELLVVSGKKCHLESFGAAQRPGCGSSRFRLVAGENSWSIDVLDELRSVPEAGSCAIGSQAIATRESQSSGLSAGVELLLDVELEATLRFGCCEMPLGEILELGPGDVVELDRHVSDPVDLIVGDKIVARGDVVLINGNFGLRITEVAEPQKRLESIRCLF